MGLLDDIPPIGVVLLASSKNTRARWLNSGVGGTNGGLCWRLADGGDADRRLPVRR
jgi:hypothetical protein